MLCICGSTVIQEYSGTDELYPKQHFLYTENDLFAIILHWSKSRKKKKEYQQWCPCFILIYCPAIIKDRQENIPPRNRTEKCLTIPGSLKLGVTKKSTPNFLSTNNLGSNYAVYQTAFIDVTEIGLTALQSVLPRWQKIVQKKCKKATSQLLHITILLLEVPLIILCFFTAQMLSSLGGRKTPPFSRIKDEVQKHGGTWNLVAFYSIIDLSTDYIVNM